MTAEDAEASVASVRAEIATRTRRARRRAVARRVMLAAFLAVALGVAGWLSYGRFVRAPGSLPLPSSVARNTQSGPNAWPTIGGNLAGTRVLVAAVPIDGELTWSRDFEAPIIVPVVSGADTIYVALADGQLLAISAADGRELWATALPDAPSVPPTVAGDRVYLALPRGRLLSIDTASGEVAWEAVTGSAFAASPLVADGVLYAFGAPHILGLDAEDGAELWRVGVDQSVALVYPVIEGDTMAVATTDQLLVFDRRTGERTYWYQVPPVIDGIAIDHGTLFVAASRTLVAIDAEARRPWWELFRAIWFQFWVWGSAPQTPAPPSDWVVRHEGVDYAPAVSLEHVFTTSRDGSVAAYLRETGELRWARSVGGIVDAPVLTAGGLLLAQSEALLLLDPQDGRELYRRLLPGMNVAGITVTNHGAYLTTKSGGLRALR